MIAQSTNLLSSGSASIKSFCAEIAIIRQLVSKTMFIVIYDKGCVHVSFENSRISPESFLHEPTSCPSLLLLF